MTNIVAIVGRPNVGKSTFFNRITGQRDAIMHDQSGVTRDRHYGYSEWNGKHFSMIDTGGYVHNSEDIFEGAIRQQVHLAIEEATVILFMVDVATGLTPLDEEFAQELRKSNKPVIVLANKADNPKRMQMTGEFYAMGFDTIFPVSSQNGSGTGDLLDEVVKHFTDSGLEDPDEGIPRIAILGRPNVGKSSLVNLLLGEERSIVTDVAGTTRDSVNARYKAFGQEFILTDTAGIRKKGKVKENIEFYSVMRSIRAMESADVCIVMVDAQTGVEAQDLSILSLAHKRKKGILLLVNKWDLVQKETSTSVEMEKAIKNKIAPLTWVPVMFVSVLEKQRILKAIQKAIDIYHKRTSRISTSKLNEVLLPEIEKNPPPSTKGKYIRIKYVTQLPTKSPTFVFFCNYPKYIRDPYMRFLENKIRQKFDFEGVPVKTVFREK